MKTQLKKTLTILLSILIMANMLMACGVTEGSNLAGTKCDFIEVINNGDIFTLAQMNGLGQSAPTISFDKKDFSLNAFDGIIEMKYKKGDGNSYDAYVINEETKKEEVIGHIKIDSENKLHVVFDDPRIGSKQEYIFQITE